MDKPVSLGQCAPKHETAKALLVEAVEMNLGDLWIPKSAIHDDSEVWKRFDDRGELVVKQWFARMNGWS